MKLRTSAALLATAAGAAAGYYFYASKNAKKNRKIAAKWAGDLRADVVKQAKEFGGKIDKKTVVSIVDGVTKAYTGIRGLDRKEVMRAAAELKKNWNKVIRMPAKRKRAKK